MYLEQKRQKSQFKQSVSGLYCSFGPDVKQSFGSTDEHMICKAFESVSKSMESCLGNTEDSFEGE